MKIIFEGDFQTVIAEMRNLIGGLNGTAPVQADAKEVQDTGKNSRKVQSPPTAEVDTSETQGPGPTGPEPVVLTPLTPADNKLPPVDNSGDKPVHPQIAKMRAAKAAKQEERRLAKEAANAPPPVQGKTLEELEAQIKEDEAKRQAAPPLEPADAVKLRQKTIEDLQAAYANGHQQEVFELLSRFGNGAKSFRELPPEAFVPIREAIDNGALT